MGPKYTFDESIRLKEILLNKMGEYDLTIPEEQIELFILERPTQDIQYECCPVTEFVGWGYCSDKNIQETITALVQIEEKATELKLKTCLEIINKGQGRTFSDIVVEEDSFNDVRISMTTKIDVIWGAVLKEETLVYKEVLEFVFKKMKEYHEDVHLGMQKHFEMKINSVFQEKWIFQRRYIDYYIKKSQLPNVEVITELSACFYEGSENESRVYFTMDDMEVVEEMVSNGQEIEVNSNNRRLVRKLMEISKQDKIYLYAKKKENGTNDSYVITSLIRPKKSGEKKQEKGKYIKFMGFLHWSVVSEGRETIGYYQGRYIINFTKNRELYEDTIDQINDNSINKQMIKSLVLALRKQKHGTSVILMTHRKPDFIRAEVNRLCKVNRGIKIDPQIHYDAENDKWDEDVLLGITSIDGALMMDWEGRCLAIGIIVDGVATIEGNVSRGARYNSICTYVMREQDKQKLNDEVIKYIGIIMSEDGMVDVITNIESC